MGAWAILVQNQEATDMAKITKKKSAKAGFFTKILIVMLLAVLTWQLGQLRTQVEGAEQQRQ